MIHEKVIFFKISSPCLAYLVPPLLSSKDGTKACEEIRKPQNESARLRRNPCSNREAKTGRFAMSWVGIAHKCQWRRSE